MTFETDADRLAIINGCGAEDVTLNGTTVRAIFENAYVEAFDAAGTRPQLLCRSSDVTGITVGHAAVVRLSNYVVRNLSPDGTGMTIIDLERS
jgi:hypothetical protein